MNTLPAAALMILTSLGLAAAPQQPPPTPADASHHPPVGQPEVPQTRAGWPKAQPADVESLDATVKSFYALSSGAKGEARDWDRYRSLFLPEARLIAARATEKGAGAFVLTVDDFVGQNRNYFERGGFFETEVARRVEAFGSIAQVWSTYESRHDPRRAPYVRGINSIQLLKDGDRWWIVNVFWDFERPESAIPGRYLPGGEARP
ncbi:MAG: hypothetical protein WD749_08375 [Phycisphaerales bacterium]